MSSILSYNILFFILSLDRIFYLYSNFKNKEKKKKQNQNSIPRDILFFFRISREWCSTFSPLQADLLEILDQTF